MLRWTSAGGAVRQLDSHGATRTRLGRPILRALGIPGRILRASVASGSHVHRIAGRNRAHAARTLSHLYVSGIVAVVPGAGLSRNEAGRKLARVREILPQIRRGDWGGAGCGRRLFCLESLAEQNQPSAISHRPSVKARSFFALL